MLQTEPPWRSIESTYVICENDKALDPRLQQLQAGPSDLEFSIADGGKPKRYRITIRDERGEELRAALALR